MIHVGKVNKAYSLAVGSQNHGYRRPVGELVRNEHARPDGESEGGHWAAVLRGISRRKNGPKSFATSSRASQSWSPNRSAERAQITAGRKRSSRATKPCATTRG